MSRLTPVESCASDATGSCSKRWRRPSASPDCKSSKQRCDSAMVFSPLGTVCHGILQFPDPFDRYFDAVTSDDGADAFGGSGRDQVAGLQCHHLGNVTNDYVKRENEILRVAGLADIAVYAGFDLDTGPRIKA